MAHANTPKSITRVKINSIEFALCSSEYEKTICTIVNDNNPLYNPLLDPNCEIHLNHWYSPYKIKYTPIEFNGIIKEMYVTDFCSHVRDGYIELIEYKFNYE